MTIMVKKINFGTIGNMSKVFDPTLDVWSFVFLVPNSTFRGGKSKNQGGLRHAWKIVHLLSHLSCNREYNLNYKLIPWTLVYLVSYKQMTNATSIFWFTGLLVCTVLLFCWCWTCFCCFVSLLFCYLLLSFTVLLLYCFGTFCFANAAPLSCFAVVH